MPTRALLVSAVSGLLACGGGGGASPADELRRAVIEFNGHVVIMKNTLDFTDHRDVASVVREQDGVVGATPFAFAEGVIHFRGKSEAMAVKGIAVDDTPVGRRITPPGVLAGYRPPARPAEDEPIDFSSAEEPRAAPVHVVMGAKLARELGVQIGDVVDLVIPAPPDPVTWKQDAPPLRHQLRVVGTIEILEYEQRMALATFEAVQAMLGQGDRAMGVEVRTANDNAAARVAGALRERLGPRYTVLDWCELNQEALRCKLEP